ncbi:MAG TPA: PAS domain-containing protein, partial [Candidatus Sulfopaludibacter sp.]|nr:PAS domain-containing protein [Candidatus Sulfopaludibacter sp.]
MAQTGIPAEAFGRLYVASSQIGHAIVRCRSREELLREVVRTLVESAGFAMAAISWHDPASHELIPVAAFGDDAGYTSRVRIFTDERPEGRGPGGTAFREDAPCFCNDFLNDPRTQVWREAARASGWRASAAIPIRMGGKPRGLLSVYAREIGFFGRKESELVLEVAGDVAIGLERLDAEEHRCLAEAALSASERRLKLALDAAEIGTFDWATGTGKSAWGGHFDRLFGFATGEFDGSWPCLERRLHPDDLPGLLRTVQAACDTHTPFVIEFRVLWTGGDIRWVGAHGEFYYGPSGRPARVYGAVRDITEQKRAATALHESEERLRQAIRVSDIGIFDHDHLTDIIYWSPQQRAIHGWGPEEPVTLPAYLLRVHDEDRARIAMAVRRAHDPAGDGLFDVEYRMLFPNGSVRWARVRSQTFFAGDGGGRRPVRTVGAVTDITERKQAEEEQKKLASVVEMSGEFIGIATLEGQVVYLNNAALALAGLESMEEARGKTIFDFFADSHLAQARDEMYGSVQ